MNNDDAVESSHLSETTTGLCASIAALAIALDEVGLVNRARYDEILKGIWLELPDEDADGEAGAVIEQVLDLVDKHTSGLGRNQFAPADAEETRTTLSNEIDVPEPMERDRDPVHSGATPHRPENNGCRQVTRQKLRNRRQTKHAPLLGAPFDV